MRIRLNNMLNVCSYGLLLFVVFVSTSVLAAQYQSHASIYSLAKTFMQQNAAERYLSNAQITPGKLDSRLKLKACEKPLQAYLPNGSRGVGKTTVGIKCTGTRPWSINLPVKVSVYQNVLVATKQLNRGATIKAGDIKLASRDLADLPYGYVDDYSATLGMKLKRRISSGFVITPAILKKPQLISRGQRVTILADTGKMQVRMSGKALGPGAAGDRITVVNISSKQKLEGVITDNGEVKVDI